MASVMDYLINNAKHFGSYGSDLPIPYHSAIVANEHNSKINPSPADTVRNFASAVNDVRKTVDQFVGGVGNNPSSRSYSSSAPSITPQKVAATDFINADLAKHYGMSKSTAYQEALSNTAYQRAVNDMKSAGLNPAVLFGSGRATPSSASVYASEARSGGGGGYSRRYGSGSSNGKLFSGSAYSAIQAIGGLVGLATTKRPDGFWIGSQTAKGAMGLLDAVWKK